MQNRLDIILETVDMILEGSKRKWSKAKRVQHARGTADAALNRYNRAKLAREVLHMKQMDDLGRRGHPYNPARFDARRKLALMPGTGEEITGRDSTIDSAINDESRAGTRFHKIFRQGLKR